MKKILSILCISAILCTSTITAFAADNGTNPNQQNSTNASAALQKRSDSLAKRIQFLQFKQSLSQKREAIRQNRDANRDLVLENTQLRKDIVDSLLAVKENGGKVSQDVQVKLKAYNQQIKEMTSALKATKGSIKDIVTENKQNIKDMNYEAVDAAYSQIITIQQNRADQLAKINDILKSMKALLSTTV